MTYFVINRFLNIDIQIFAILEKKLFIIILSQVNGYAAMFFCHFFFQRETTIVTSCLLSWTIRQFQNGFNSQRKEFAPRGANSLL